MTPSSVWPPEEAFPTGYTRHALDLDSANDDATAFGRAHATISAIVNLMARYSAEATLNPNETCEFPADMEQVGGKCLIFDGYARHSDAEVKTSGFWPSSRSSAQRWSSRRSMAAHG